MAVLSKDDYFANLQKLVGDDTSDETLSIIGDLTDTYNSFNSGINWQQKYEENDASWRRKYRDRFFGAVSDDTDDVSTAPKQRNYNYSNLFKEN